MAQRVASTGSECIFMVAGGMAMHLNDAFGRVSGLRYYCNHHEQASAMAADAYARESGKLGVCVATSGPGATNLLTGLVGAYQDSVPILFLTGQCKRVETVRGRAIPGLRQCGFLEVDIVPIVQSVTKYAAFVESPERARYHLEKAIDLAMSGRPGPVLLDVPLDVQGAVFSEEASLPYVPEPAATEPPDPQAIARIIQRLDQAKRPLLLAGHGFRCAESVDLFRRLVHQMQIPVVTSMMAKDLLPYDEALFVGHCGPRGLRGANFAVQLADLIVIVGCSLHVQTVGYEGALFAPEAYKIQIDLDRAVQQRESVGVQEKHFWDIREYLPQMAAQAAATPRRSHERWVAQCTKFKHLYAIDREPHDLGPADGPVNLYEFVIALSEVLDGSETILTDAGQPHPILGQAFRVKGSQRYLNPGSFAEMGYALPAAFGVAAADPAKEVIVVIGDGSLQTNIQELQTLVHHGFAIKLFVINNGGYGSIRRTQETFFKGFFVGATPESGVTMPSSERICQAYGLSYQRIENRSRLSEQLRRILATRGPIFCEVMAQYDQRILPVVPSYLAPDGSMKSEALHKMVPKLEQPVEEILRAAVDES